MVALVGKYGFFGGEVWWGSMVGKHGREVWWGSKVGKYGKEVWWGSMVGKYANFLKAKRTQKG